MPSLEEMYDTAYDFLCDDETDKAIAAYKAILDIDPNYVEAVHDLAHAYSDNEQLDDAIEMAKKLTELSPGDEMSFTVLSRLYQQKGMVPEAEATAAQARMLDWKRQLQEQEQAENKENK
jgi:tetratricopeptide (TPR) repeat protein